MKVKILNNFLKKEKINFFTLDEIDNYKSGVLLLDSNFFHLIPLTFPKDIDEREREFEITEKLEAIFDEYDSFYFLEKELPLESDELSEKTLLILIEKDKIYTLLDNLKEKKIVLLGIYPLFLVELFNRDSIQKTYVEIDENRYRIYHFSENRLVNFEEIDFDMEDLINNPNFLEKNIAGDGFVYPNQKEIQEYFPKLKIKNWKEYNLELRKDFNFLPLDYIRESTYKKSLKLTIASLSILIIISTAIFFSLQVLIKKEQNKIEVLEESYFNYHEKNLQLKDDILKIEEEIKNIKEKNRVREFNTLKLSQLIKDIYSCGNLNFSSIEYGDNTLILKGISHSEEDIYKFQNNLLGYKIFKNFNHDFIKLNNNNYEFHIEIEVDNGALKEN